MAISADLGYILIMHTVFSKLIRKYFKKPAASTLILLLVALVTLPTTVILLNPEIPKKLKQFLLLEIPPKISCANTEFLYSEALKNYPNKNDIKIENPPENPSNFIEWKRNPNEPFLGYEGQIQKIIYLYNTDLNKAKSFLNKYLIPVVEKEGFIKDPLNELSINPGGILEEDTYHIGLINPKLKDFLVFEIDEIQSAENSTNTSSIYISCSNKSSFADGIYDKVLPSSVIQKELDTAKGENGISNSRFIIHNVYNNGDIIESAVLSYDWLSGYALWVAKVNGEYKKIFAGQQDPTCDLLESFKIEKGVNCIDSSSNDYRQTR